MRAPAGPIGPGQVLRICRDAVRRPVGDPLAQDNLADGLRQRSARGAVSTLAGQWTRLVLQTVSTVVLARLIAPHEYGLVAMVVSLVGIGDALWNLGLSQATVQRRDVRQDHVTFFFWLQLAIGAAMTLATALLAPLLASFYSQPELVPLTRLLSLMFVLNGLSAQHLAVLTRRMRFGLLSAIEVLGLVMGITAAIIIAALGGGAWAIAVMFLAAPVARLVVAWPSSGWAPSAPRRAPGVGEMLRFGLSLTVTNVLDYTAQNLDNVLIGRFYSAEALGLYSRAYNLLLMPLRQVTAPVARVAIPVLSYLQDQPARFRRFFMAAMSAAAYASLPMICFLAGLSHEVISVLLGDRWLGAVPIFKILSLAGILVTLRNTNGWLFVATGHTGRQAVWALVNRPVIILGFVAGLRWGTTGVAWGFLSAHLLLLFPSFVLSVKDTPVSLLNIWQSIRRPLALSAGVFAIGTLAHWRFAGSNWLVLAVAAAGTIALMGGAYLLWPGVRRDVHELRGAVRDRGRVRRPEAAQPSAATAAAPSSEAGVREPRTVPDA